MNRFDAHWLRKSTLAICLAAGYATSGFAGEIAVPSQQGFSDAIQATYIVGLKELPLGLYEGSDGKFPAPKRAANGKIDLDSEGAQLYLAHLVEGQSLFLAQAEAIVGGKLYSPTSKFFRFSHAFNGMVLSLSQEEAEQIGAMEQVALIAQDRFLEKDTDASAAFVGANWIWEGIKFPSSLKDRQGYGEGVVVGIIDSGINPASPSFSATDAHGFTHTNPMGSSYLGICNPRSPGYDPTTGSICNSKLIGAYDLVDDSFASIGYDGPGVEDEDPAGHGTHTASTAAGNFRTERLFGLNVELSGIAPHANVVAYNACFEARPPSTAGCMESTTVAAIDQAVMDRVVDVLNMSLSAATPVSPWSLPSAMATLAAQNAGIFIATTAGNRRTAEAPITGSVKHHEPWATTVGAITHNRRIIDRDFSITGPGTVSSILLNHIPYQAFALSASLDQDLQPNTPIIVSPNYIAEENIINDGCRAFPAGTFARDGVAGIAVLKLGGTLCGPISRVRNAQTAGAAVVFLANNDNVHYYEFPTLPTTGARATLPVFGLQTMHGNAIRNFVINAAKDAETAKLSEPGYAQAEVPYVMGDFSLIGPATIDTVKPDLVAPGVNILAAQSRLTIDGAYETGTIDPAMDGRIGMLSGTSMAAPVVAGSAALIHQVRPEWTPSEIKSALMLTALVSVAKPDARTAANPLDRGAGAIDLTYVTRPGFILNETGMNYLRANPAMGGQVSALNLPSYQNLNCRNSCSFTRRLKSVSTTNAMWEVSMEGRIPGMSIAITPSRFTLGPSNREQVITVTFNTAPEYFSRDTQYFGNLLFKVAAGRFRGFAHAHRDPQTKLLKRFIAAAASHNDGGAFFRRFT